MSLCLIIGYGRAGKRHAKHAEENGLEVITVDPVSFPADGRRFFTSLGAGLSIAARQESIAVIATPPALHLSQLRACLDAGIPRVLVEKPLCDLGQLEEAKALPHDAPVMVAYNYAFHPAIVNAEFRPTQGWSAGWHLECEQHREETPEWGYLLDHVSHDLQILNRLAGPLRVLKAEHKTGEKLEQWSLQGLTGDGTFWSLSEIVAQYPVKRKARLYSPRGRLDLYRSEEMYAAMWHAFLAGERDPGLGESLAVQELLEEAWEISQR